MRVERIYDWKVGQGLSERDARGADPAMQVADTVRIGHISDTHLGKGENPGMRRGQMRRWLEAFDGLDVQVVVHTGDLVEEPGDEASLDWAFETIDELSMPVVGVPGNHDVEEPAVESAVARRWGGFPRVETVGDVQMILADSMAWPTVDERSRRERDAADESGFYSAGGLGKAQRDEIARLTAEPFDGARIFAVHHHPRQPVPPKPWYEQNADLMRPMDDADEVLELARDLGATLMLHGHRHQYTAPYAPFDDLLILNAGSSTPSAPPRRARIVDIAHHGGAMRLWELVRF